MAHFLSYKRRYTHKNLQNYNIYSTVDFPTLPDSNKLITAVGKYSYGTSITFLFLNKGETFISSSINALWLPKIVR